MSRAQRYALTGAAVGLYFGLFFRPLREPSLADSLVVVLVWGAVAAIVVVCLRLIRGWRPNPTRFLTASFVTYAQYAFVLAMLEIRHLAYDFGGRTLVVLVTVLMGAVAGFWLARGGATLLSAPEQEGTGS